MGNEGSRPSALTRRSSSRQKSNAGGQHQLQYTVEDEVDSRVNEIVLQTPKPLKRMDKIRRSLSFRKKKKSTNENVRKKLQSQTENEISNQEVETSQIPSSLSVPTNLVRNNINKEVMQHVPVSSTGGETVVASNKTVVKPANWIDDEKKVRAGNCSFQVKYLGALEVADSRGMHLCESAIEKMLAEKVIKKPIKAILYVSGDSLRVVDESNKTLLVDQTIEKVSFCAPDRHHENGFAYICRDGTTRRWLCYCFMAIKDTLKGTSATGGSTSSGGERLSHAVGCAFSVCLEKKQKREKENVSMEVGPNHSFSRFGSFRQASLTERLEDPQMVMPGADNVPIKQVANPYAIERPKANPDVFTRQNSLRMTGALQQPFKRGTTAYTSLKPGELPSFQLQKANSGLNVNGPNSVLPGSSTVGTTKTSLLMQQHQMNSNWNNNNNSNVGIDNVVLSSRSQTFGGNENSKINTINEMPEDCNSTPPNTNNITNEDKWTNAFPTPQSIPVSPTPVTPPPLPPMPTIYPNQNNRQQLFQQQNHLVNNSLPVTRNPNLTPIQQQISLMSITPNNGHGNSTSHSYSSNHSSVSNNTPNSNETFEQKWTRIQAAKKTNPFAEDIAKKYEIKLT